MNSTPSLATDLARNVPLTAGAAYLSFISQYGAAIVTTLAIVYAVMQITMRIMEHRAVIRRQRLEADKNGSD